MLMSHMESKGQRWPDIRLGKLGDVSAAFNYGISDMMMNNLWVYDVCILDELNNNQISEFPDLGSSEIMVSDPGLSSRFLVDMQQNRENDDPNSMKAPYDHTINKEAEMIVSKTTQKCAKGQRSKRCRRTVFKSPQAFKASTSTPSMDLYGSIDNQRSAMSKRILTDNFAEPTSKIQKGGNLESNDLVSESIDRSNGVDANSVGRWLEDVGFGRYAGMFEMHEVDEEALPLLTLDDLKEMGVLAVGPRRRLYAAISKLKGGSDNN